MGSETHLPRSVIRNKLVHVVDRDPITCEAVMLLMKMEGFEVSFSLSSHGFIQTASRRVPDVLIANFLIDELNGFALLREARRLNPACVVVMLADHENTAQTVLAVQWGANDVLAKPLDHEKLSGTVRRAIAQDVRVVMDGHGVPKVDVLSFSNLSARERQVLELIVNGETNKSAAKHLGISARTIEVHRANCMKKLRVRHSSDLIRLVMSTGFLLKAS